MARKRRGGHYGATIAEEDRLVHGILMWCSEHCMPLGIDEEEWVEEGYTEECITYLEILAEKEAETAAAQQRAAERFRPNRWRDLTELYGDDDEDFSL